MPRARMNGSAFGRDAVRLYRPETDEPATRPTELNARARRAAQQFDRRVLSPRLLSGLCRLVEFAVFLLCGLGSYLAYVGHSWTLAHHYLWASLAAAAMAVAAIELLHGYDLSQLRSRRHQLLRLLAGILLASAVVALGLFLLKTTDIYSRVWLLSWAGSSAALLSIGRIALGARIRRWARNGVMERRAVLVGGGSAAEAFIRRLEMQPDSDIRICGIFDDRDDRRSPPIVAGYPKLGSIGELTEFARLAKIDMLVVTLPMTAEKRVLSILKELWVLPLDIRISALSAKLRFRPRSYSYVGDLPMVDVFDRPLADWDWVAKRAFDLAVTAILLVVLAPLMVLVGVLIKLDTPGPVFFRQKRHGFNNQTINVWKFRSLRHEMADPTARKVVTRNDARVTRVGRFIRKTSIDELPQLFNVMAGDLSLVGPRPHAIEARSSMDETFTEIVDGYYGRHKVKPGITGWAQIKGWRGEIDDGEKLRQRVEHDLYYIENWSVLLDLYILVATPISLLKTENAY